jgi:tRNA (uracil-5-)-methyltransferase
MSNNLEEKIYNIKKDFVNYTLEPKIFTSPSMNYRMRIECNLIKEEKKLRLNNFSKETISRASMSIKLIIDILLIDINSIEILKNKLFRLDFLSNQSGEVILGMIYHKKLDQEWKDQIKKIKDKYKINIVGLSKKQKIILDRDYLIESINLSKYNLKYKYTYGQFSQPNTIINQKMLQWVIDNTSKFSGDMLELYCGSGNFSIALSPNFEKILASEVVKKAIKDAEYNIEINNIQNIKFVRMSSDEIEQAFNKTREFNRLSSKEIDNYNFTTVLVDPPRSGLNDKVINFLKTFNNIVYISCNPKTLLEDIRKLDNYQISNSAIFDQFPGTEHVESGLILKRN